jgi:hypothetical protein
MANVFVQGLTDLKPYKVHRVTATGDFVSRVAEYATAAEALAHPRRLDWQYRIWGPGPKPQLLWPVRKAPP